MMVRNSICVMDPFNVTQCYIQFTMTAYDTMREIERKKNPQNITRTRTCIAYLEAEKNGINGSTLLEIK